MTQQINLIAATLLPTPQRLAPARLLAVTGAALALVLAHFGWERMALAQALAQAPAAASTVDAAASSSPGAVPDPALPERLAQREALRDVLRQQVRVADGSALLLAEIFRVLPDGLWLTEVELGAERALRIAGGAVDAASFGQFTERLARVPQLQGLPITTLRLEPLADNPATAATAEGHPALRPAHQRFVLASAAPGAGTWQEPSAASAEAAR
ncbi:MAG: PilN domain-containing protein [Rubrivivax sp.]|nr:PilN domain-containing protein [Rubrivivax sp.]